MGYCYDAISGMLVCDGCGKHGGVRKVRCPFGYCPPPALCQDCRTKHRAEFTKASHAECAREVEAMRRAEAETAAHLAAGRFVRAAALAVDDGRVHVLFKGAGGQYVGRYMSPAAYRAFPLLAVKTIEDYAALEPLIEAPADFYPEVAHATA